VNLAHRIRVIAVEIGVLGAFLLALGGIALVVRGVPSPWLTAWPDLAFGAILLLVGGELASLRRPAPATPASLLQ
jgi:membrane protein implicated in regulation of membrane protease activity